MNIFIYHYSAPFNIVPTKELKEREAIYGFHWSHHVSHHLSVYTLTGQYYNLLKTQLSYQLRDTTLSSWRAVLWNEIML